MIVTIKFPNLNLNKVSYLLNLSEKNKKIILKNFLFFLKCKNTVGISGVQVGFKNRIFAIKDDKGNILYFSNPKIKWKSNEKISSQEGCLSVPGFYREIKRSKYIKISAFDLNNKNHYLNFRLKESCRIQHEIDHLNGILINS